MNKMQNLDYGDIEFPLDPVEDENLPDEEEFDPSQTSEILDFTDVPPQLIEFESDEAVQAMDPAQRIERLFENMYSYKQTLLAILSLCKNQTSYNDIAQLVEKYGQRSLSVYATDNFLNMLVKAGALNRLTAQGTPYEEVSVEPIEVEDNGITYLEIIQAPEVFWQTSKEGIQALVNNDSVIELNTLFSENEPLKPAFRLMLEMCSSETGASIQDLRDAINQREEVIDAHKTAQFLLDYLSNAGAVVYDIDCKGWKANETGTLALHLLQESDR